MKGVKIEGRDRERERDFWETESMCLKYEEEEVWRIMCVFLHESNSERVKKEEEEEEAVSVRQLGIFKTREQKTNPVPEDGPEASCPP